MSWIIPGGLIPASTQPQFPLETPDPDFDIVSTKFYPAWNSIHNEEVDWAQVKWFSPRSSFLPFQTITNNFYQGLAQHFADAGEGSPLAVRLYHREIFDVEVPDEFTIPSFIPWVGGNTYSVPVVGGTTVVAGDEWYMQIIYHNPIALAGVWAFLVILLGVIVVIYVIESLSGGKVAVTEGVKQFIEELAAIPKETAGAITTVLLLGIALFAVVGWVAPHIATSASTAVRAGPVTTTIGGSSGRGGGSAPRR